MTVEKQIQGKINELINNVNKIIPVDWDELYINSEMSETGGNVYFFFKVADNDNLFYSLLIPDDFKVDEKTFEKMDYQNYGRFLNIIILRYGKMHVLFIKIINLESILIMLIGMLHSLAQLIV